jgi:hypothetical protein
MKGIESALLIVTILSTVTGLMFYAKLYSGMVQISQGNVANGTETIVNATADEIVGSVMQSAVITVIIAVLSSLGIGGCIIAILRKL